MSQIKHITLLDLIFDIFITCIASVFPFGFILHEKTALSDGLISIIMMLSAIALFWVTFALSFFLSHYVKAKCWEKNGYEGYPTILYPVWKEYSDRRWKLLSKNGSFVPLLEDFYPKSFIAEFDKSSDHTTSAELCLKIEKKGFRIQIVFSTILFIAFALLRQFYFLPFCCVELAMIVTANQLAIADIDVFASRVRCHAIKDGGIEEVIQAYKRRHSSKRKA